MASKLEKLTNAVYIMGGVSFLGLVGFLGYSAYASSPKKEITFTGAGVTHTYREYRAIPLFNVPNRCEITTLNYDATTDYLRDDRCDGSVDFVSSDLERDGYKKHEEVWRTKETESKFKPKDELFKIVKEAIEKEVNSRGK